MKKFLLMSFVTLILTQTVIVNAQTIEASKIKPTTEKYGNYMMKYKNYKTAGWFLLGSGIAMIVGGGLVWADYAGQGLNGARPATAETLFFIIGPSSALASIPFFILAKSNKRKAQLALKEQSVSLGNKFIYKANYIAFALTIQL